jgi:hypothetical protein
MLVMQRRNKNNTKTEKQKNKKNPKETKERNRIRKRLFHLA